MAKLDARRIEAFLADPGRDCRVALLHGDDVRLLRPLLAVPPARLRATLLE